MYEKARKPRKTLYVVHAAFSAADGSPIGCPLAAFEDFEDAFACVKANEGSGLSVQSVPLY